MHIGVIPSSNKGKKISLSQACTSNNADNMVLAPQGRTMYRFHGRFPVNGIAGSQVENFSSYPLTEHIHLVWARCTNAVYT